MKALAIVIALVGATVHTGEGPALEHATVVVEGGRISALGANVRVPSGATVVDVSGKVITPGLVALTTRVGVGDVPLEPSTVEATLPETSDPVRAALRAADTYDPRAWTVERARSGGITAALVVPSGGLIAGLAAWVELAGEDPVRRDAAALRVSIAGPPDLPGGSASAFLRLREAFDDARLFRENRGPFIANRLRSLSVSAADLRVLARALDRELPLAVAVDRASDIRTVLALAREYELRVVITGGAEAWLVADELARAAVPVVLDPTENLPYGLGAMRAREDGAAILHRAGVRIAFAERDAAQRLSRLRQLAGNAVASGVPYDVALAAITRTPADVFANPEVGRLRSGGPATLVVWNGDPLEVGTWPEQILVRGAHADGPTRADQLRERYRAAPSAPTR